MEQALNPRQMISIHGVEKRYQTARTLLHALKDIHLEIEKGEIFGILGRANSGKTSLLRCLHSLEKPSSGSIVIDNTPLTALPDKALSLARRNQGMIFQEPLLLDSRTVFENVALPLELAQLSKREIASIVQQILQMTGLAERADYYPISLNMGQKQRVNIARALVHNPKVVLCDDITQTLDAKTSYGILKLLRELNEYFHFTLVVATQDMEVIKSICHRVAVLHQGEIVEQATVHEFFTHPKKEISKEFVKTATRLEMPTALRRRLKPEGNDHSCPVLRMSLTESQTQESLIAHVVQHFGLSMNILQAHLEPIRDEAIGVMVVELRGAETDTLNAIMYLEEKGLHIEILGYVA